MGAQGRALRDSVSRGPVPDTETLPTSKVSVNCLQKELQSKRPQLKTTSSQNIPKLVRTSPKQCRRSVICLVPYGTVHSFSVFMITFRIFLRDVTLVKSSATFRFSEFRLVELFDDDIKCGSYTCLVGLLSQYKFVS